MTSGRLAGALLFAVLAAAAAIEARGFSAPITGARDAQSAAIARHLREDGLRGLLYPRPSFSADGPGFALMEFPLVGALGAVVESVAPALGEAAYRLPSAAFAALAVVSLFALARRRLGDAGALAAAALLALSPLQLEMGATPRPDEAAFALSLAALALADRGRVGLSGVVLALAFLAKTTFAPMGIAWVALMAERSGGWRPFLAAPRSWLLAAAPVVPVALWQWHAGRVNAESSLMGSLTVLESAKDYFWQKGRVGLFVQAGWWAGIAGRAVDAASIGGFGLAAVGAILLPGRRGDVETRGLALGLLAAFGALLVLFPWHTFDHHYYALPIVALTALLGGVALDAAARRAPAPVGRFAMPAALAVAALAVAPAIPDSLARLRAFSAAAVEFGDDVARLTPEGARVVVAAPFIGPWDGSLLYRARRDGWRYSTTTLDADDPEHVARIAEARRARRETLPAKRVVPFSLSRAHRLDPAELTRLRARGATFLAYAGPLSRLQADRPDLAAHLESTARLITSTATLTLFSL